MREHKYKVWIPRLKQMSESFNIQQLLTAEVTILHKVTIDEEGEWLEYTGFKDKDGREIYEGDVLTLGYSIDQGQWTKYGDCQIEVKWRDDKAGFYPFTNFTDIEYVIIKGNIYEHPELLSEVS